MTDQSSKSGPVKFSEVLEAYEFANFDGGAELQAYVGLETGKIYCVTGQDDLDEEIPEDIGKSGNYLPLPDRRDLDLGSRLVFSFADQVMPDDVEIISDIFRRKGAYSRFKDFLDGKRMLDKWHGFEARATEDALRAWCQEHNIALRDE